MLLFERQIDQPATQSLKLCCYGKKKRVSKTLYIPHSVCKHVNMTFCLWAPATIVPNQADHFYPSCTSSIQAGVSCCCRGKSWMLGPWTLDVFPKYSLIKMTVNVHRHLLSALHVSGWEGGTFANCACSFSWRLALEWCVTSGDLHREGWGQNHRKSPAYERAALDVMQKRCALVCSVSAYWMCLGQMGVIVRQSISQSFGNSQWPWGLITVSFKAPNSVWEC